MSISGSVNFIIRGDQLDFQAITEKIKLNPTCVMRKGDQIGKAIQTYMKDDYWEYQQKYQIGEEPNKVLASFLDTLLPFKDYIKEISSQHDVYLRFFLQSDLAQMGVNFEPNIFQALAALDSD